MSEMFTVPEKVDSVRKWIRASAGKCSQCQCQKMFTVPERFTVPENVHMQCLKMFTLPEKVHIARKGSQCLKTFRVPASENVHSARKGSQCQKSSQCQKRFTVPEKVRSVGKCSQCQKRFTVPEKVHSA